MFLQNRFSLVSCLFIFFHLDDELGKYIIFQLVEFNFIRCLSIIFEMAIEKLVNFFRLFHFMKVLTKPCLKGLASLSNILQPQLISVQDIT